MRWRASPSASVGDNASRENAGIETIRTNPETLKRLQRLGVKFTLAARESKTLTLPLTNLS